MAVLVCSIFGNNRSVSAAAYSGFDYADYAPGVTVEADATSPTGYYATFVYEEETARATKVELYSATFHHFTFEDGFENPYKPEAYKPGMFPAGANSDTTYYVSLEKIKGNVWGGRVPLSSGAYLTISASPIRTARQLQDWTTLIIRQ